jgi:hypothetical protein
MNESMGFNDTSTLIRHFNRSYSCLKHVVKLKTYIYRKNRGYSKTEALYSDVRERNKKALYYYNAGTTEAWVQYPTLMPKRHAGSLSAHAIDSIVHATPIRVT